MSGGWPSFEISHLQCSTGLYQPDWMLVFKISALMPSWPGAFPFFCLKTASFTSFKFSQEASQAVMAISACRLVSKSSSSSSRILSSSKRSSIIVLAISVGPVTILPSISKPLSGCATSYFQQRSYRPHHRRSLPRRSWYISTMIFSWNLWCHWHTWYDRFGSQHISWAGPLSCLGFTLFLLIADFPSYDMIQLPVSPSR